ncbi:MAG: TolC family protein [Candidatus Omnitrophota bacterium]
MKIKDSKQIFIYFVLILVFLAADTAFAFTMNFSSNKKQSVKTAGMDSDKANSIAAASAKKEEAQPAKDPVPQDLQAAYKPESNEVVKADKKILLNIPGAAEGEKFTIGNIPDYLKEPAEKIKQADPADEKDAALARNIKNKKFHGGIYTLKECIDIAVRNHLPLQIAQKSVKLAEMRVFESRRNMLPSATLDYQQYHGRVNGLMYYGRKQTIEGQQPIFRGGELLYTMKQSEVNLSITKNDYGRIRNDLVLTVKKAYYTLAKAKTNLKMQEDLYKEVWKSVDMVEKQAAANVISKIETMNVQSQASQIRYQLASAGGDVDIAELILKQAMNVDPKEEFSINESLEFKKIAVDYEKALSIAMVNRPEMKINSLMIDYYNYGKGIAKAKFWPKVDLLGSWGLAKEEYASQDEAGGADLLNGEPDRKLEQQWYAGLKVGVPFWGSSGEYSLTKEQWVPVVSAYQGTEATTMELKLKILDRLDMISDKSLAEIDFDKARQELTKVKQDLILEVKESCFNYQKALIQTETAENKIKYQTSDLELVKLRRGLDEVTDSNVIESMIKLSQEKFGLLQALSDCHVSIAAINKAIGIEDYYKDE